MTAAAPSVDWRVIADELAIGQLVARYPFYVDDGDIDALVASFVEDGRLWSDGLFDARGAHDLRSWLMGHLPTVPFSNHVVHQHVINLDATEPDRATGLVAGHAELQRGGVGEVLAMRYHDVYRRVAGVWKFGERRIEHLYRTEAAAYADALADVGEVR